VPYSCIEVTSFTTIELEQLTTNLEATGPDNSSGSALLHHIRGLFELSIANATCHVMAEANKDALIHNCKIYAAYDRIRFEKLSHYISIPDIVTSADIAGLSEADLRLLFHL
jgi:hypothetical protein